MKRRQTLVVCALMVVTAAVRTFADPLVDEAGVWAPVREQVAAGLAVVFIEVALLAVLIGRANPQRPPTRDALDDGERSPSASRSGSPVACAARETEARFRRLADTLPVGVWLSNVDGGRTYVNRTWLDMTGRSIERELGMGWLEAVHADDRERCMSAYRRAFAARETLSMEYRLRRRDGQYRWMLDNGVPHYDGGATFLGYLGGAVDFTDQRQAENALRHLGGKLIAAQEHERRRIARDLHDSVSQRVALASIHLDSLRHLLPDAGPAAEIAARLREDCDNIAREVHALSHRLHSAKLDALGLVAAIASHCREVSEQGVLVQFSEAGVPDVPRDIALCMFRIVQEALANVVKHSGATSARVTMSCAGDIVRLRIEDDGRGFAAGQPVEGLGLVSMRERVRSVAGELTVRSAYGQGTAIEARVPMSIAAPAPIPRSELSGSCIENCPPLLVLLERSESTSG
jgi:PAS domain S-box-containing protein